MTDRNRRRLQRPLVEVERGRGIGGGDVLRHETFETARQGIEKRQERQRKNQVEGGVEVGDRAGIIRLDLDQAGADRGKKRQRDRRADKACDDVPDDDPSGRRVSAPCAFDERIERRPDIRADDEGASAALVGMTPISVKDITISATATLEWAAQASSAPKATEIKRSVAIAPMRIRRLGTSS